VFVELDPNRPPPLLAGGEPKGVLDVDPYALFVVEPKAFVLLLLALLPKPPPPPNGDVLLLVVVLDEPNPPKPLDVCPPPNGELLLVLLFVPNEEV